jgi:hypothetical protein
MSLYLTKVKWKSQGSNYPNPKDLMNIDLFIEYKSIDCKLSVYELNKFFKDEPFLDSIVHKNINSNDMQMIRDGGFTILWHSFGLYWILFDMDSPFLVDFKREFKLRQILGNRFLKLNEVLPI